MNAPLHSDSSKRSQQRLKCCPREIHLARLCAGRFHGNVDLKPGLIGPELFPSCIFQAPKAYLVVPLVGSAFTISRLAIETGRLQESDNGP